MAGQPLTLTLPSNGDPFATAAPQVVEAIEALEVELERKVVPADMSMSADLSFLVAATNYRVTDLLASSYVLNSSALSAATCPRSVYFTGTDGDAYVNDGAGRQIQLTANGVVNNAASGNITSTGSPAYGASSVELRWDGADLEYEMRAGAGADAYADVRLDDVLFNDGSGNFIRLGSPALSSDYTITLPAAVPASTSVVQMSSGGVISASPSGPISTTGTVATGDLTVTGVAAVSGAIMASTLDTSGLITGLGMVIGASGFTCSTNGSIANNLTVGGDIVCESLTLETNEHVTISGTGRYKHGDQTMVIPAPAFQPGTITDGATVYILTSSLDYSWKVQGGNGTLYAPIILPTGARLKSVVLSYLGGGNAGTRELIVASVATTTGTITTIDSVTGTSSTVTNHNLTTASLATTLVSTSQYILDASLIQDDRLRSALVTYDYP